MKLLNNTLSIAYKKMAKKFWRQEQPLEFLQMMRELKTEPQMALAYAAYCKKMTQHAINAPS